LRCVRLGGCKCDDRSAGVNTAIDACSRLAYSEFGRVDNTVNRVASLERAAS